MDVGRVVPVIIQGLGARHAPADQQRQAHPPMAEIGQRHRRAPADAQQMLQHAARAFPSPGWSGSGSRHRSTCAGYSPRSVSASPCITDKPARHAGIHILLRQFDAAPVHVLGAHQMFQQRAVAAADIQHARAGRDHFGDGGKVGAQLAAHATPLPGRGHGIEKAAHGVEHFRLVQQEGVMAPVGLDLDKADIARPRRSGHGRCACSRRWETASRW